MKEYFVEITEEALADLESIYTHIAFVLLAPENAMGQYDRIAERILKLSYLPERNRIMDAEPEHSIVHRILKADLIIVVNKDKFWLNYKMLKKVC